MYVCTCIHTLQPVRFVHAISWLSPPCGSGIDSGKATGCANKNFFSSGTLGHINSDDSIFFEKGCGSPVVLLSGTLESENSSLLCVCAHFRHHRRSLPHHAVQVDNPCELIRTAVCLTNGPKKFAISRLPFGLGTEPRLVGTQLLRVN